MVSWSHGLMVSWSYGLMERYIRVHHGTVYTLIYFFSFFFGARPSSDARGSKKGEKEKTSYG